MIDRLIDSVDRGITAATDAVEDARNYMRRVGLVTAGAGSLALLAACGGVFSPPERTLGPVATRTATAVPPTPNWLPTSVVASPEATASPTATPLPEWARPLPTATLIHGKSDFFPPNAEAADDTEMTRFIRRKSGRAIEGNNVRVFQVGRTEGRTTGVTRVRVEPSLASDDNVATTLPTGELLAWEYLTLRREIISGQVVDTSFATIPIGRQELSFRLTVDGAQNLRYIAVDSNGVKILELGSFTPGKLREVRGRVPAF